MRKIVKKLNIIEEIIPYIDIKYKNCVWNISSSTTLRFIILKKIIAILIDKVT